MIDAVLNDRYEITANLGRGGSALVYRARDLKLKRDVAIKVLAPDMNDAELLARLQRESECMAVSTPLAESRAAFSGIMSKASAL